MPKTCLHMPVMGRIGNGGLIYPEAPVGRACLTSLAYQHLCLRI